MNSPPAPKRPVNRAMMLAVGESIIERVGAQANGLAKACLNPAEKFMAEFMVGNGILLEARVDGIIFLFLPSRPPKLLN